MSCPTDGVHYWADRGVVGRLRGRAFPRRAFTGGFALFAQPSRDLAGDSSNIATAYAEMHVKIAKSKCNHQMSVDAKVHACVQATVQLQLRAA